MIVGPMTFLICYLTCECVMLACIFSACYSTFMLEHNRIRFGTTRLNRRTSHATKHTNTNTHKLTQTRRKHQHAHDDDAKKNEVCCFYCKHVPPHKFAALLKIQCCEHICRPRGLWCRRNIAQCLAVCLLCCRTDRRTKCSLQFRPEYNQIDAKLCKTTIPSTCYVIDIMCTRVHKPLQLLCVPVYGHACLFLAQSTDGRVLLRKITTHVPCCCLMFCTMCDQKTCCSFMPICWRSATDAFLVISVYIMQNGIVVSFVVRCKTEMSGAGVAVEKL